MTERTFTNIRGTEDFQDVITVRRAVRLLWHRIEIPVIFAILIFLLTR